MSKTRVVETISYSDIIKSSPGWSETVICVPVDFKEELDFTYYGEGDVLDFGWGCTWRCALNTFWRIENQLQLKNISPIEGKKRVHMSEIKQYLGGKIKYETWLEPHDVASIFFNWVEDMYPKEHHIKIYAMYFPVGKLIIPPATSSKTREDLLDEMCRDDSVTSKYSGNFVLNKLASFLSLAEVDEGADRRATVRHILSNFYKEENIFPSIYDALSCKGTLLLPEVPLIADDFTYTRNIIAATASKQVFVGEVHVWENDDIPLDLSVWMKESKVSNGAPWMLLQFGNYSLSLPRKEDRK